MRVTGFKVPLCGTDQLVIENIRLETVERVLENGSGDEMVRAETVVVVEVRPYARLGHRCPECGRRCACHDHAATRRWRACDCGQSRCYLEYAPARVECPEHGVLVEAVTWARPRARHTRAFEDQVAWACCHLCRSAVRELMRVGDSTVGGMCSRVMDDLDDGSGLDGLRRIGIDETGWGSHRVMTVVVDHDRCRVVWAGPGVGRDALAPFFEALGPARCAEVELVSADGADWIRSAVREFCPGAEQVMDPFHVVKWATDALDEVRRQALREARAALARLPKPGPGRPAKGDRDAAARAKARATLDAIKGTRWPVLKDPADLTDRQRETLDLVAVENKRLFRCYLLKEGLRDVFSVGAEEGCAEELLDAWLSRACRSRIPEMVKVSRAVRKRRGAILLGIERGLSNSRLEAVNNKIKVAIRMGYGFANIDNLIALVMLRCSGVSVTLPGRQPEGWRTKGSARRTRANMGPVRKRTGFIKDAS